MLHSRITPIAILPLLKLKKSIRYNYRLQLKKFNTLADSRQSTELLRRSGFGGQGFHGWGWLIREIRSFKKTPPLAESAAFERDDLAQHRRPAGRASQRGGCVAV
jgi:hypothetical protein